MMRLTLNLQDMRRERKGERLSLTDLLAKPHQRIPRYRLLIQVIHYAYLWLVCVASPPPLLLLFMHGCCRKYLLNGEGGREQVRQHSKAVDGAL